MHLDTTKQELERNVRVLRDYETKVIVLEKYIQSTSKNACDCNCKGNKKGGKATKPKVPASPSKPGRGTGNTVSNGYVVRQSSRDSVRSAGPRPSSANSSRPSSAKQSGRNKSSNSAVLDSLAKSQLNELRRVFDDIDSDNSGYLSKRELRQCFRDLEIRVSEDEMDTVMHQMDTDSNGKISFDEFAVVMGKNYYKKNSKDDLIEAFKYLQEPFL